jgi:transposase-like protein
MRRSGSCPHNESIELTCGVSAWVQYTLHVVGRPSESLKAGIDYPATFPQLQSWFADDDACRYYLEQLRWPNGFVCPVCACSEGWRIASGAWMCRDCGRKTSVTAGTIFDRTRSPLSLWFAAVWFVCSQKSGVSALGLQRVLGFASYETAWTWLHKLRRAMVNPERDLLEGLVEVDETYFGARGTGNEGRGTGKTLIVIGVEILPQGFGRVRLARVPDASGASLRGFVHDTVAPGATVRTDGFAAYRKLANEGYHHTPISVISSGEEAHAILPGVHRVASLLKRWLTGTLHYSISSKHFDYYLDEFTFRFNRRNSRSRGLLFYRLLEQAVITDPHPLRRLTATGLDPYI